MRNSLLTFTLFFIIPLFSSAQPEKTYFSIEEAIANKEQVYKLSLRNIKESSTEILQLKNIKKLNLSGLKSFPEEILQLQSLEKVNLLYHEISVIP